MLFKSSLTSVLIRFSRAYFCCWRCCADAICAGEALGGAVTSGRSYPRRESLRRYPIVHSVLVRWSFKRVWEVLRSLEDSQVAQRALAVVKNSDVNW